MIKQLLEQQIERFTQIGFPDIMGRFVLKHGKAFEEVAPYDGEPGQMKLCFSNSAKRAIDEGYTYVEGYCVNKEIGFLFHHAWLTDGTGKAFDPTILDSENYEYFGITFPTEVLLLDLAGSGYYCILDKGAGINVEVMYAIDPKFEAQVEAAIELSQRKAAEWQQAMAEASFES